VLSQLSGSALPSNVVLQGVSLGTESLHEQLQVQAVARITALSLPGIASVKRAKLLPNQNLTLNVDVPACLVSTWKQTEEYPDGTNAYDDTTFPLLVAFISQDLNDDVTDATVTMWRQLVRRGFRSQRLPVTGASHYMTDFGPGPIIDIAYTDMNYQASTMLMKLKCREPRGLNA
jgi:hypothetical protein